MPALEVRVAAAAHLHEQRVEAAVLRRRHHRRDRGRRGERRAHDPQRADFVLRVERRDEEDQRSGDRRDRTAWNGRVRHEYVAERSIELFAACTFSASTRAARRPSVCSRTSSGAIVSEGRGPGANLHTAGELAVEKVLHEVMEAAIGDRDITPAAICLGIAGVDREDEARDGSRHHAAHRLQVARARRQRRADRARRRRARRAGHRRSSPAPDRSCTAATRAARRRAPAAGGT